MPSFDLSTSILIAAVVLGIIGTIISSTVESDKNDLSFLRYVFLGSYVLRIIVALFILFIIPEIVSNHPYLSYGFFADDAMAYDEIALQVSKDWQGGYFELSTIPIPGARGYILLNSVIYYIFGHNLLAIRLFESFIGSLIPIFSHAIAKQLLLSNRLSRFSTLIIAFYPEQILYSVVQLKEISLTFSIVLFFWCLLDWKRKKTFVGFLGMTLPLAYILVTRFYFAFPLLLAAIWSFLTHLKRVSISIINIIAIGIILLIASFLLEEVAGVELFNPLSSEKSTYNILAEQEIGKSSLYSIFSNSSRIQQTVLLPIVIIFVLLNPFIAWPFIEPDPVYNLLLPAIVIWYILLPFIISSIISHIIVGRISPELICLVFALLLLAISGGGAVAVGRLKVPLQPIFLIYAVDGISQFRAKPRIMKAILFLYYFALTAGVIFYSIKRV